MFHSMAKSIGEGTQDSIPEIVYECVSLINANSIKKDEFLASCPLCKQIGKNFYCVDCIRNGNFTHSKKMCLERYADKKLKHYKVNEKKSVILQRYEKALSRKIKAENLKRDIELHKEKIQHLKKYTKYKNDQLARSEKIVQQLKNQNNEFATVQVKFVKKIDEMKKRKQEHELELEEKEKKLQKIREELRDVIHKNIQELITHIFPISKVDVSKNSKEVSTEERHRAELEEAQKTTYVQGMWVIATSQNDNSQYSIVEPCIPASGDYSAYTQWLDSERRDSSALLQKDHKGQHAAYGISAALSFTAHLLCLLAFYLDIHVPKRLSFSEFYDHQLGKEEFLHKVTKLNANILHICLSQNIDLSLIHPHRTIANLLLLFDSATCKLGRFAPIEMKQDAMDSIEASLSKDLKAFDDNECENCEDVENDFVHISDEEDVPDTPVSYPVEPAQPPPSFVSSVFSLFRAATGQK